MMENIPENNSGQDNNSGPKQAASAGKMLREAREKRGLTVAEVAGQIKFAPRQIEALEADDFKNLPEAAFLRGFVRSYAKILRLDAEILLASLPLAKAPALEAPTAAVDVPFPSEQSNRQQNMIWLGAAIVLALMVAGFSYWHFKSPPRHAKELLKETPKELSKEQPIEQPREEFKEQPREQPETKRTEAPVARLPSSKMLSEPLVLKPSTIDPIVHATPKLRSSGAASSVRDAKTLAAKRTASARKTASELAPASSVASSGTSEAPSELLLLFGDESWTEIKDRDGNILSSQVNPPGSELRVQGNPPFSMLIGHAASASLFFQGKEINLKPYINQYSEVAHLNLK
ncbi:MAG: RodZ domain-containing protein [Gallionella sp.]